MEDSKPPGTEMERKSEELATALIVRIKKLENIVSEKLDPVWKGIEEAFQKTFCGINMLRNQHLNLHCDVYKYFIEANGGELSNKPDGIWNQVTAGSELYKKLTVLLETTVLKICDDATEVSEKEMLSFYARKWNAFQRSCSVLNSICSYLNKCYVFEMRYEGRYNIVPIYELGMNIWRNNFLSVFDQQITSAVLQLIEEDRKGEVIDSSLVRSVIQSYIELAENIKDDPFSTYVQFFEDMFIHTTAEFYTKESSNFLLHNSLTEYMKKVDERLKQEMKRVETYLHTYTYERLQQTCKETLITNHLEIFLAEFINLLQAEDTKNIAIMYLLLGKIPDGLDKLRETLEKYIFNKGISAIEMCRDTAVKDVNVYFTKIINIHQHYTNLITEGFSGDITFIGVLDKACVRFINVNAVTKAFNRNGVTAELLAKYCDFILKKSNNYSGETELEDTLTQAMMVFKYIEDRDVFEKFYSQYYAKRLINQMSTSDDAESSMISKLKEACGWEYTNKLQRMHQDIEVSKDLHEKFLQNLATSATPLELDFKVQVLSSGYWNLKLSTYFYLPNELEKSRISFEGFYNKVYSGRKLSWNLILSMGELQTNCLKKKYTFQVSTMQMSILLMYNNRLSYSVHDLQKSTGINMEFVIQVLQILIKCKLLTSDDGENLQPTSVVSLFTGYKNKKLKVNINVPLKIEEKADKEATQKNIERERSILIQAAIVRIMKMKKTLDHQQLIIEVWNQLNGKFKAEVSVIKKCISVLIEKEYMKQSDENTDVYEYLA